MGKSMEKKLVIQVDVDVWQEKNVGYFDFTELSLWLKNLSLPT